MSGRRMDDEGKPLEKIGTGTPLQAYEEARLGRGKRRVKTSVQNRVMVVLRRPIRIALTAERDLVDPTMSMSKFIREHVIGEWLRDRGYTVRAMEREAMRQAIAEEQARLDAEEGEAGPRYALEA